MKPATPEAQLAAAKAMARRHGLFISTKGDKHHVYRSMAHGRPVHLGFRHDAGALFDYVDHLTRTTPAEAHP